MKFVDRLKFTTTAVDTSLITVFGTFPGYRSLVDAVLDQALSVGDTEIPFCITDPSGNWELGLYYLTSSSTLTRSSIEASSNSGNPVDFQPGVKEVFCTISASMLSKLIGASEVTSDLQQAIDLLISRVNATNTNISTINTAIADLPELRSSQSIVNTDIANLKLSTTDLPDIRSTIESLISSVAAIQAALNSNSTPPTSPAQSMEFNRAGNSQYIGIL
jgi:hypothetical protein